MACLSAPVNLVPNHFEIDTTMKLAEFGIETTNVNTAQGVTLSRQQKLLVYSVLDLFKGKPTLSKLQLWTDDAAFNDPLSKAIGRKKYEAQWYGLKAAFEVKQLHSNVTCSGNPIKIDLITQYKIRGLFMEKIIMSEVRIYTDASNNKITGVDDLWSGGIPEGKFASVGFQILNPCWWTRVIGLFSFWLFSLVWWTRAWEVFRNLGSIFVTAFVSVPKSSEEELPKKEL